ncbi:MAG: peptidase s8 and s53 subtilisin kexin [Prolixibacteraceae bacterium]|nr:MAG: peptidase s8 and s53 subtilisin kexin [Prolixibacteraceae bacterium]
MTKYLFLFFILFGFFYSVNSKAQEYYWVGFSDKKDTRFSLSSPGDYLSERAIQRRIRQNIIIDSLDLPVNQNYIDEVVKIGASFIHASKWLNGITVKAETDSFAVKVSKLPFVMEFQLTKGQAKKSAVQKFNDTSGHIDFHIDKSFYGLSVSQTSILNGQFLHNQNYLGQGMHIAVLDGGFYHADRYPAMDSLWANNQILGTKDFVDPTVDFFKTHYHGMSVLSCIGGNVPGKLIGTAPKASYWLIRSEDTGSEFLIEEDNWVAAAEFADSAGVDIINSSLGYTEFDDPQMNHTYYDLDGKTTRVTRGANIAASRGILVFSSAGNQGNKPWKYLVAPSDGDKVTGVGAVNKDSIPAGFTSLGPAFGGKTKPNVTALGWNTYLQKSDGSFGYLSGTSFSSPVMAGMAACLWQSQPHATAEQIKSAIEMTAHLYGNPNDLMGFGIPDMYRAWQLLLNLSTSTPEVSKQWAAYPNPVSDVLILQNNKNQFQNEINIEVYTIEGKLVKKWLKPDANRIELRDINELPKGILLLKISSNKSSETIKLSKTQ